VIYSSFRHQPSAISESLCILLESLRPNAGKGFENLTQALFEKTTLEYENHIADAFRQPHDTVALLLAKNRLYNRRFEHRRNRAERASRVQHYCQSFQIPQREAYLDLLKQDARSRIIAGYHCGDFLYGSASLLSLGSTARRKFFVSLSRSNSACFTNLAAGFDGSAPDPKSELVLSETDSTELSQILREGNASIVLFVDLPLWLNETTAVNFLGRRAFFSIGPAILALANRVPILPLLNYSAGGSSYVVLGEQIEPLLSRSETLRTAAQRITQSLVSFFEAAFLTHPEQWRFLSLLPSYFCKPADRNIPQNSY